MNRKNTFLPKRKNETSKCDDAQGFPNIIYNDFTEVKFDKKRLSLSLNNNYEL